MTNRRDLLKIGLAAAALPVAARAAIVEPAASSVSLYKVLYDTRFEPSVAFARRAAAGGLATHAMTGDVTPFWYDDLYHRWKQAPAAIAGLTAYGALFCLERLAWDQRMRVVYRGEHSVRNGSVTHRFQGSTALLPSASADAEWAAGRGARSETLYSWVIAPVARG